MGAPIHYHRGMTQHIHPDVAVGWLLWDGLEPEGIHYRVKNAQGLSHVRLMDHDGATVISGAGYPRASKRPLGVTQTSGLLYRRPVACLPRPRLSVPVLFPPRGFVGRHADWKSATQQTGGLRYAQGPSKAKG